MQKTILSEKRPFRSKAAEISRRLSKRLFCFQRKTPVEQNEVDILAQMGIEAGGNMVYNRNGYLNKQPFLHNE